MRLTLENIQELDLRGYITVIPNKYQKKAEYFEVLESFEVELSNGDIITIEDGFKTDGSSVPFFFRWAFARFGAFLIAAIIHDWLYKKDYKVDDFGFYNAQKFADNEMLIWSHEVNNRNIFANIDNWFRFYAVRS